jgi:hypothetical protein
MAMVSCCAAPKEVKARLEPDDARITLRQGARMIEDSRRLRTV